MRFKLLKNFLGKWTGSSEISAGQTFLIRHANSLGYFTSEKLRLPVDQSQSPIPWVTYPALEYLAQIDKKDLQVFEFGSGYSTLYWQKHGAFVSGVEHDERWFSEISTRLTESSEIFLASTKTSYVNSISKFNKLFDVVVIDGVWRNECAWNAINYLSSGGIIILDNSDWYTDVVAFLDSQGFVRVDFNGPGPINNYSWTTSIFFRGHSTISTRLNVPTPCLGIAVENIPLDW